jgi:hypothetical protein
MDAAPENLLLSEDGFNSSIWGPHLWTFMHILSMNYPLVPKAEHRRAYYMFFKSLCTILPCAKCRKEFCSMVNKGSLRLTPSQFVQKKNEAPGSARRRLVDYVISLHCQVNVRLKKPGNVLNRSREYWIQKYAKLRSRKI